MKTTARTLGRILALGHLANERGMLLVITMVVLLVLTTLAATNLINAFIERSLAKNQNYAAIALNAADAGISAGLSWVNDDTNFAGIPTSAPWNWTPPAPITRTIFTDDAGTNAKAAAYSTTLAFKADAEDLDGDGNTTEYVLYNSCAGLPGGADNCFGYTDSLFSTAGAGFPIMGITSVGTYGAGGYREVVLEVARNKFNLRANGALTAASNVNVTGSITVDGRSHDSNGNLGGTCTDAFPGVNVAATKSVDAGGSSNLAGAGGGWDDSGLVSNSPDEVLGLCDKNGDGDCADTGLGETENVGGPLDQFLGGLPAVGTCKNLTYPKLTYCNETADHNVGANGTGVLVVHNPLFNPRAFRVSVPVVPDPAHPTSAALQLPNPDYNPADPAYDPKLDCLPTDPNRPPGHPGNVQGLFDPSRFLQAQTAAYIVDRKPRNLTMNSDVTWKGAIIADSIDPINGNADVIGAMVSLTTVSINVVGMGSARILYSCDALNLFGGQRYSTKTAWHRTR